MSTPVDGGDRRGGGKLEVDGEEAAREEEERAGRG